MYYKHIEKVNLHPCIDLPAGKMFTGIEPAGGGGFTTQQGLILVASTPNIPYIYYNRC